MDLKLVPQFRTENDFRTREILMLNKEQETFRFLYEGKLGAFFDNTHDTSIAQSDSPKFVLGQSSVMPRAEAFLRQYMDDWQMSPIETTNYVQLVCEIYSDFIIGDGINVLFNEGDTENAELWEFFSHKEELHSTLVSVLHEWIYAGYGGLHMVNANGRPGLDRIFAYNYYPEYRFKRGYSRDDIYLKWTFQIDDRKQKEKGKSYDYVIHYLNQNEEITGDHRVYDHQKGKPFEIERMQVFKDEVLTDNTNISADGTETILTRGIPVYMGKSNKRDSSNLGCSYFRDLTGHLQDLTILNTITSDEFREHFNSKVAIPESAVSKKADGSAQVRHDKYFIMGLDAQPPQYITKDASFFEHMFTQRRSLVGEIANVCHVPEEILLQKESGNEIKVEVAKIKNKPFIKSVSYFQRQLRHVMNAIVIDFFESIGKSNVNFDLQFEDPFELDRKQLLEELVEKFDRDMISRQRFLQVTDGITPDEAKELVKERADEDEEFGLGAESGFDSLDDGASNGDDLEDEE